MQKGFEMVNGKDAIRWALLVCAVSTCVWQSRADDTNVGVEPHQGASVLSVIEKDIVKATEIIERDPDAGVEYLRRATRLSQKMELVKSIKDYGQVLRLAPKNPRFFLQRGELWR